jgi:hypothetical protein
VTLAPVREAADSLVKAATPQPFSASKTSNWIARLGGLPDYIQHLAHGIQRSGKSVSEAIEIAVGLVQHPPAKWDANAKAAAKIAAGQWAALRARNAAKKVSEAWIVEADRYRPTLMDEHLAERDAMGRLVAYANVFGIDGMVGLLGESLLEAAQAWKPTLKPAAKADRELERHDVYDGAQKVGTLSSHQPYDPKEPARWKARAVNGSPVGASAMKSKNDALSALQTHLGTAPARVIAMPTSGQFLVATPSEYGETSYRGFPNEAAARHSAGLPPTPTVPETNSRTESIAEGLRFDLMTVSGLDVPPLRRVQEARRRDPFRSAR